MLFARVHCVNVDAPGTYAREFGENAIDVNPIKSTLLCFCLFEHFALYCTGRSGDLTFPLNCTCTCTCMHTYIRCSVVIAETLRISRRKRCALED